MKFVDTIQKFPSILLPLSGTYLSFTLCRLAVALLVPANFVLVPAELLKSGPTGGGGAGHADNACSMWANVSFVLALIWRGRIRFRELIHIL